MTEGSSESTFTKIKTSGEWRILVYVRITIVIAFFKIGRIKFDKVVFTKFKIIWF